MPRSGTSTSATARAARRNVPSPPSTTRTSVVGSSRTRAAVSPDGRCHSSMPRTWHQPAARALSSIGRLDRRVVGEADAGHRHAPVTSAIRSPISAQPGPAARSTRNSRLPSGPVIGEAMTARVPRPCRRGGADGPLEDLAMDRRVADDAVVGPAPAGLELGLDQRDDRGRPAPSVEATGPRTSVERDERHVDRGDVDRLGQASAAVRVAGVRPLHRDDPRVAPERLGELAAADVESVDAASRRAAAGRR